jgi:hypothetical protein
MGDEAHPQVKKDKPMNKQARRTESSETVKADSVADYIVERLAAEGISHCFGVAGDYLFPICDAVDSSTKGRRRADRVHRSYSTAPARTCLRWQPPEAGCPDTTDAHAKMLASAGVLLTVSA